MAIITVKLLFDLAYVSLYLFALYLAVFYYHYITRSNPLPGPIPLPIVGSLYKSNGDLGKFINKMQAEYGDFFELYFGSQRTIWIGRGDLLDKMMSPSTKTNFFCRMPMNEGLSELGMQFNGILFNRDATSWRFNRKFLTQTLMSPSYLKSLITTVQDLFSENERYWAELGENYEFEFAQWAHRLTFDITLSTTTGRRAYALASYYNTLVPDEKKSNHPPSSIKHSEEFLHILLEYIWVVSYFTFVPRIVRHYFPGFSQLTRRYLKTADTVQQNFKDVISERQKEIENTPLSQPLGNDMLTLLLTTNTERDTARISKGEFSRCLTLEEIRQSMVEVIVGGTDTAANSLVFITYYVCQHPNVKAKLINEIDTVFGGDFSSISLHTLEKLTYCEAVIKEVARLIPIVPMTSREIKADEVFAGRRWEAGTVFYANIHGLHKNESHWNDHEKFIPERFLRENNSADKNWFLPFGGGIRMCPGRHVAMTELKVFVSLLFGRHDVQLVNETQEMLYKCHISNTAESLKVHIKPRSKA